ncbi:MAG: acyloxyacyl hydrolase [Cytophagales bacterium]|nr:acyloxyacyl hydrolase [Cytophagales bacterium]
MSKRHVLLVLAFSLFFSASWAQNSNHNSKKKTFFKHNSEFGALMVCEGKVPLDADGVYYASEFKFGWQTTKGKNNWDQLYRYPSYGIGFYTGHLESLDVGKPNALFGWLNIPIVRSQRSSINYEFGFGISYNFNPHDDASNPLNLIIGSKNNAYINVAFDYNYILSERFDLQAGIGYKHFSNGSYQLPNSGVNLLNLQIGVKYKLKKNGVPDYSNSLVLPVIESPYNLYFFTSAGSKQIVSGGGHYPMYTFSLGLQKRLGYKNKIGLGLDTFWAGYYKDADGETIISMEDESFQGNLAKNKAIQLGLFLSGEMIYDRLSIFYGAGYYLHKKVEADDGAPYYLRAQARYFVYNNLFSGIGIKAHGGRADYIEWTIGYNLNL